MARETSECSPSEGLVQSNVKNVHEYFADGCLSNRAGIHLPSSIFTSTVRSGVPSVQAAPFNRTLPSDRRTARAMIDLTSIGPTLVSRQIVLPSRSSTRMVKYSLNLSFIM